jgi:hypothetical protein
MRFACGAVESAFGGHFIGERYATEGAEQEGE